MDGHFLACPAKQPGNQDAFTSRIASLNTLATRQAHDLAWAVNSPSLLSSHESAPHTEHPRIDINAINASHLSAFLAAGRIDRVGRYFERLISYWLHHVRQVKVVAESLSIRQHKRTIGEIDFLFHDELQRLTHMEIAVKFYLFSPDHVAFDSHYLGPNAADTLDRKVDRLLHHQLPRSETLFPEVEIRQPFLKGRIFYQPAHRTSTLHHPLLSPDHLSSSWIRESQFDLMTDKPETANRQIVFSVLQKPFWLSNELRRQLDTDLLSCSELSDLVSKHFSNHQHCLLVAKLVFDGASYVESSRFFVVPESWPKTT